VSEILQTLKNSKAQFLDEGVEIVGIFGSFARNEQTSTSDIDIAYKLSKEKFFSKYNGFKAAVKLSEIKEELSRKLKRKVDFISFENSNKELVNNIKKEIIYV